MISNASSNPVQSDPIVPPANTVGGAVGQNALRGSIAPKRFDAVTDAARFELIRDVVAVANSGGGGLPVDCSGIGNLSASVILQQIAQYADSPFTDLSVRLPDEAANATHVEVVVGPAEFPIGFRRSAPRAAASRLADEESAFAAGKFYFRHGDASVPGTSADLRAFFLRVLSRVRRRWLRQIRRVLSTPIESVMERGKREKSPLAATSTANLQPVRIVTDLDAPALQPQDVDHLYPWRQKDLVQELNKRIGRRALTTYDIQAVRRQHHLDERPDFVFHLEGAGRRYSPAIADWMMEQFGADPEFFQTARTADQAMLRLRRQKPR
jgi:hypothetical protein